MTDRAALKQAVHDKLMALEEAELADAIAHYEAFLHDSALDGREGHDKDELALSRENADLAAAFDTPVQAHHAKIDVIEGLDFSLKEEVAPGAVVGFGGRRFVVAVSTGRFSVGGQTYMGISVQSPIYNAMKGLCEGDSFDFNGREMDLDEVF